MAPGSGRTSPLDGRCRRRRGAAAAAPGGRRRGRGRVSRSRARANRPPLMPIRRWMRQTESSMPIACERLVPGQDVLVDAVDQRAVEIEDEGGPARHRDRYSGRWPQRGRTKRWRSASASARTAAALDMVVHQAHGLHEGVDRGRADEASSRGASAPCESAVDSGGRGMASGALRGRAAPGGSRRGARSARRRRRASPPRSTSSQARRALLRPTRSCRGGGRCRRRRAGGRRRRRRSGRPARSRSRRRRRGRPGACEDGEPAQAGLEALEAELLEQAAVVVDGAAPFLVVVGRMTGSEPAQAQRRRPSAPAVRPLAAIGAASVLRSAARRPGPSRRRCRRRHPGRRRGSRSRSRRYGRGRDGPCWR